MTGDEAHIGRAEVVCASVGQSHLVAPGRTWSHLVALGKTELRRAAMAGWRQAVATPNRNSRKPVRAYSGANSFFLLPFSFSDRVRPSRT